MGSRLHDLARMVSDYAKERFAKPYRQADQVTERTQPSAYARTRRSLTESLRGLLFGQKPAGRQWQNTGTSHGPGNPPGWPEAPPIQQQPPTSQPPATSPWQIPPSPWPSQQSPQPPAPSVPAWQPPPASGDEFDDVTVLGRDAGYHADDFAQVMDSMRETPGSSNVYGYLFQRESDRSGILYVTFLATLPGGARAGAGPTYAYYDVPVAKAMQFQRAAEASAGTAVWDYCRIRGTVSGHQHDVRLVHVAGDYVPRKATPLGFRNRAVPSLGVGRREFRRNTLPERRFSRGEPNRGGPNRGTPNRGN